MNIVNTIDLNVPNEVEKLKYTTYVIAPTDMLWHEN